MEDARAKYNSYIETGFAMTPPFKGFAMEHVWFAMDEPELYKALFTEDKSFPSLDAWIEYEGHKDQVIGAIKSTFGMEEDMAYKLYLSLVPPMLGLISMVLDHRFTLSISEIAECLGFHLRASILALKAGDDSRTAFVPGQGAGPEGRVSEYIDKGVHEIRQKNNVMMLQTMIGQNRLLSSLHSNPRYVKDNEWVELDRLTQGGFGVSRRTLSESNPVLTQGDVRLIILEKLGFGVSVSALLLGISPASVTKTRQRLKAKLGIDSVDDFVKEI